MLLLFLRIVIRTVIWLVLAASGGLVALLLLLQITAVSLWPVERLLGAAMEKAFAPLHIEQIAISGAYLHWSRQNFLPYLGVREFSFSDNNGAQTMVQEMRLVPSGPDFWRHGRLYLSEFYVRRATIKPALRKSLPPESSPAIPRQILPSIALSGGALSLDFLQAINKITILHIDIVSPDGGQIISTDDSKILINRTGNQFVAHLNIDYQLDNQHTKISGQAVFEPEASGLVKLNLQNLSPRQLARFSRALAPLAAIELPISASAELQLNDRAQPSTSVIEMQVQPGQIDIYDESLAVEQLALNIRADFAARALAIDKSVVKIGGVAANMQGSIDYVLSADGRLKTASALLSGDKISINRPSLLRKPTRLNALFAELHFDAASQQLMVERLSLHHRKNKTIEIDGKLFFETDKLAFDIKLASGALSRAEAEKFWPVPLAPRTYDWVKQNVSGGRVLKVNVHLASNLQELLEREVGESLPEEAILLDLHLADARLNILKSLPPLDIASGNLALRGKSFAATMQAGQMRLPPTPQSRANDKAAIATLENGHILIPDYRAVGAPAQIRFSGAGAVRRILALLQPPPINLLRDIGFNIDDIDGFARADVKLNLPLVWSLAADKSVQFEVRGHSQKIDIGAPIGPYRITQTALDLQVNNQRLIMEGAGQANDVALKFHYQRPLTALGAKSKPERLILTGQLVPQDLVRLGQGWIGQRFEGVADVKVTANGSIIRPHNLRIAADIGGAKLLPVPLAYEKPIGVGGRIFANVTNDKTGRPQRVDFDVRIKNEQPVRGRLQLNGAVLTGLKMTPINLGATKNLQLAVATQNGLRQMRIIGDEFDMRKLRDAGNLQLETERADFTQPFDFLGTDYDVEIDIGRVFGAHNVWLDGMHFLLHNRIGRYEEARLQGRFADGSKLIGSINRLSPKLRRFHLQSENGSNLFRLLGLVENINGGRLNLQSDIFDDKINLKGEPMTSIGQFTMRGFRLQKVPLLARLLSLVSVKGLVDTFSGEGIKFRKAEFGFWLKNSILTIHEGRMNGAAIGLTLQGDIDIDEIEVDLGGTVIPAFSLNNFLTRIPIIGTIFGNREGEGLFGVSYRITSHGGSDGAGDGRLRVTGNPLSLFTPGIFRRIFEIGTGF